MIKFFVNGKREREGQKELKNKKIMFTKFRFFFASLVETYQCSVPFKEDLRPVRFTAGRVVTSTVMTGPHFFNNKAFSNVAQTLFDFYFSIDASPSKASLLRLKVLGDPFSKVSANV